MAATGPLVRPVHDRRAAGRAGDSLERPGHDRVPLEHARWFATRLAQLTPAQVRRAFEAAGATADEIEGYSTRVMEKIAELQAAVRSEAAAGLISRNGSGKWL